MLEPSPPAINEPPWFADDPAARGEVPPGRFVVSPVGGGDLRWDELAEADAELAEWCADRWLGAWRRLAPAPGELVKTRSAWHQLAARIVSPARQHVNGKIGLRYTRGGFGTPFFGEDLQVRVAGTDLIVQRGADEERVPITNLPAANAHVLGRGYVPDVVAPRLPVDAAAARFLGDWFGFAALVLEELRSAAHETHDPSRVQLWPEHFDLAAELGSESAGGRAAYGCSPGDEQHPEPYLYVAPWVAPAPGELWQADGFAGAELAYAELLDAEDQRQAALEFFRIRLAALAE